MCDGSPMDRPHIVRTPDGRLLEVYLGGPEGGAPFLFHNGTPGAGLLYAPLVKAASERELRTIGYSRAGYGDSSRNPGRSIADIAADATAILDAVGADRFHTLGWSGGGPHALACAALMPERVIATATIGGVAPYAADGLDWMAGMAQENVDEFGAALAGPTELQASLEAEAQRLGSVTPDQVAASLRGLVSEVDRAAITGEYATWLADVFRESIRNGIWGWFDDDLAFTRPWGFDPGTIRTRVAIWQGAQDRMVPLAHGEWLAAHIPGARAHLHREHGHLSMVTSFGLILDDLLALGEPSSPE
jgi:pimeloyl-ACP methyl ester carboxylesterase